MSKTIKGDIAACWSFSRVLTLPSEQPKESTLAVAEVKFKQGSKQSMDAVANEPPTKLSANKLRSPNSLKNIFTEKGLIPSHPNDSLTFSTISGSFMDMSLTEIPSSKQLPFPQPPSHLPSPPMAHAKEMSASFTVTPRYGQG